MLRLMLTCHSNISIPPEGPFATQLMGKYGDDRDWSPDRTEQFARDVLNSAKIDYWKLDLDSLMFQTDGKSDCRLWHGCRYSL